MTQPWRGLLSVFLVLLLAVAGCKQASSVNTSAKLKPNESTTGLREVACSLSSEPEYQGEPNFALLVFGEGAKDQKWLVLDGDTIYVDRNGNGDLTDADEMIKVDELATKQMRVEGDEYLRFDIFKLGELSGSEYQINVWVENPNFVAPVDDHEMLVEFRKERKKYGWKSASLFRTTHGGAQIPVLFCPTQEDAQISHIDGPLTYDLKWGDSQALYRNSPRKNFDIHIGTKGLATTHSKHDVFTNVSTERIPKFVVPTAIFKFQSRVEGAEPIELECNLDLRC